LLHAAAETYDLIVVDRMLPNVDGLTIVQTIRATGDTTPVLFLSALAEVDERVAGLRAGGDDYLTKPFAMSELLARIDVLTRRGPAIIAETRLGVGDLEIDLLGQVVRRGGRPVDLTAREFADFCRSHPVWREAIQAGPDFVEVADADHTFSRREWKHAVERATVDWLRERASSSAPGPQRALP